MTILSYLIFVSVSYFLLPSMWLSAPTGWEGPCGSSHSSAQPERSHGDPQHPPSAEEPEPGGQKPVWKHYLNHSHLKRTSVCFHVLFSLNENMRSDPVSADVCVCPTQGHGRAAGSKVRLQHGSLQQTSASASPGAELFLAVPPSSVCPAQKPPSSNPPAAGSRLQSDGVYR